MNRDSNQKLRESQPILIVEDSADDFEATKRAFVKANLRNAIAHVLSGEEALAYLRSDTKTKPGLILLDLNMPGLDGRKTLEIIKQAPNLKKIPVVILTTSREERDIVGSYDLGANSYVRKPVDFAQFIEAARQLGLYWLVLNEPAPTSGRTQ